MDDGAVLPSGCGNRRGDAGCANCEARALSVCGRLDALDLGALNGLSERLEFAAGHALVAEGDAAAHVFNVTSGSLRVFKMLSDGRRQITGFLFAGDILGLATGDTYAFSAEALEPSTACRFRRIEYLDLLRTTPTLTYALMERANHDLAAAQNQMLLLGRKTALERVATFLLELPRHDPARPAQAGHVRLPMKRAEIGDYLGLTIETVSRTLTRLRTQGVIRLISLAELQIQKPRTLKRLASGKG